MRALFVIGVLLGLVWGYYTFVQPYSCPHPVRIAGTTVSCNGHMPSPDPTGSAR